MLPTPSSAPCPPALTSCTLQRLITISSCPWAKPQRLLHALERLASPLCPPCGSGMLRHREPSSPAALPSRTQSAARAAGGQAEAAGTARKAGMLLVSLSYPGMGGSGAARRPDPHICSEPHPLP